MTVATTESKIVYEGDNVETVFTFTFKVLEVGHMKVYIDEDELQADFTVNLNADQDTSPGGDVTFDEAPYEGAAVTLAREVPVDQLVDYQPYDAFPAETHEGALDKLTMIAQQGDEQHSRAVKVRVGSPYTPEMIVGEAGQILVFSADDPQVIIGSNAKLDEIEEQVRRAEEAAEAAETAYGDFRCVYHEASLIPPLICVEEGDLWYDLTVDPTVGSPLKYYDGTDWVFTDTNFTGDVRVYLAADHDGQTIFDLEYDQSFPFIFVFRNGIQQLINRDWFTTDELDQPLENQIRLASALDDATDTELLLVTFRDFKVANHPTWTQASNTYLIKNDNSGDTAVGPIRWTGLIDIEDEDATTRIRDLQALVGDYYTKGEVDAGFVAKAGDTMTGVLNVEVEPDNPLGVLRVADLETIADYIRPITDAKYLIKNDLDGDTMIGHLDLDYSTDPQINNAVRVVDVDARFTNTPSDGPANSGLAPLLNAEGTLDDQYIALQINKELALFDPVNDDPQLRDGTEEPYNFIINWDEADEPADTFDYDFSAAQDGSRILTLVKGNILVYQKADGGNLQAWVQITSDLTLRQYLPRDGSLPMLDKLTLATDDDWDNYTPDHAVTKNAIETRIAEIIPDIGDALDARYVNKDGDSMQGTLQLDVEGTAVNHAMTKAYIDTKLTQGQGDARYIRQNLNYDFGDFAITCRDNTANATEIMNLQSVQTVISGEGFLTQAAGDARYTAIAHVGSTDGHPVVTGSSAGFMSAEDKNTLDNLVAGAITGVTAGNGLTGGGTSGGVTLAVGAGSGISVAAAAVAINRTTVDAWYAPITHVHSGNDITTAITGTGNVVKSAAPTFTGTASFATIVATGNVTAFSDENIKYDISNITDAVDKVSMLNGVTFKLKADHSSGVGVIAQDVEKVFPELVEQDDKGIKSVAYGNLVGVLIEAVKEQQEQINGLKVQVNLLQDELRKD